MTTEELHYEFRRRWNKNTNAHRRSLTDLELDQLYNNVVSDYVDIFATGKNPKRYDVGFEVTQQMIDMVSTLVVSYPEIDELTPESIDGNIYKVDLSSLEIPYRHYITSAINDANCGLVDVNIEQHHDLSTIRLDFHRKANKRWKRIPGLIRNKVLYLYTDGLFSMDGLQLTYIKEPDKMCLGTYTVAPTVEEPNPTDIKPQSDIDIEDNFHHILVTMAVQEAARIYADQFQLVANTNKLSDIT